HALSVEWVEAADGVAGDEIAAGKICELVVMATPVGREAIARDRPDRLAVLDQIERVGRRQAAGERLPAAEVGGRIVAQATGERDDPSVALGAEDRGEAGRLGRRAGNDGADRAIEVAGAPLEPA